MERPDLGPAARELARLVAGVPDDALGGPTPCPDYSLGDLIDHVGGLAKAFTWAARKSPPDLPPGASPAPSGDASRLEPGFRARIAGDLEALAGAWAEPDAWTGMTSAGGVDLPGEVGGLVALDEVVIHSWDVARASGQDLRVDPVALEAVHGFVSGFSGPGQEEARAGLFGPEVAVPADASLLDRVIGMTGRDPAWGPARGVSP